MASGRRTSSTYIKSSDTVYALPFTTRSVVLFGLNAYDNSC